MSNLSLKEKVVKIIEEACLNNLVVELETRLVKDLKFDSLDCIELVMELEYEFKIRISDEEIEKMKTVSDVIELVEKKVAEK